jgi:hypothetical protein
MICRRRNRLSRRKVERKSSNGGAKRKTLVKNNSGASSMTGMLGNGKRNKGTSQQSRIR